MRLKAENWSQIKIKSLADSTLDLWKPLSRFIPIPHVLTYAKKVGYVYLDDYALDTYPFNNVTLKDI